MSFTQVLYIQNIRKISKKFEMAPIGYSGPWRKLICEKSQKLKISCQISYKSESYPFAQLWTVNAKIKFNTSPSPCLRAVPYVLYQAQQRPWWRTKEAFCQTKCIEIVQITACDQLLENGARGRISTNGGGVLNRKEKYLVSDLFKQGVHVQLKFCAGQYTAKNIENRNSNRQIGFALFIVRCT